MKTWIIIAIIVHGLGIISSVINFIERGEPAWIIVSMLSLCCIINQLAIWNYYKQLNDLNMNISINGQPASVSSKDTIDKWIDAPFEDLLKKYMHHVRQCEGITFVDKISMCESGVKFTQEEITFLTHIKEEIENK